MKPASLPAQPDWFAPGTRIWVDAWNVAAVYSPDSMLIQFDNGTIWELRPAVGGRTRSRRIR